MRRALPLALLALALPVLTAAASVEQQRRALADANAATAEAAARSRALLAAASQATDRADRARADAAAMAAQVQESEAAIAGALARVALIERLRGTQRAELARRRAPLARLMAALETLARRPAFLVLAQPGSLRDIVHVRALLSSAMPAIEARTADVRVALARSARLQQAALGAVQTVRDARTLLASRQAMLARLEQANRARSASLRDSAALEQERALGLAEKARDIGALIDALGEQASLAERLAALPGPVLRPAIPGASVAAAPAATAPVQRTTPAYRLPVIGRLVSGVGEMTESGMRTRGITIATAPNALVVAPAAGRVSYAGRFRGYGTVIIIEHGDGWTTSLTDLGVPSVRVGDQVLAGSPIARTGAGRSSINVELRHGDRAIDIARLVSRG